jgi:hypothetical protein
MTEIALLKLGHVLCVVYWLGADLGVFYSSFFVVDEKRSTETRIATAKILFSLDMAPRLSMPLMLGFGVHLAERMNMINLPFDLVIGTWTLVAAWIALVLTVHFRKTPFTAQILLPTDFWFRGIFVVLLTGWCLWEWLGPGDDLIDWAAWKLLLFAATVFCGLMIRVRLRIFAPAFARLKQGAHGEADNAAIREALTSTRPYVWAIWIIIVWESALGVHLI